MVREGFGTNSCTKELKKYGKKLVLEKQKD